MSLPLLGAGIGFPLDRASFVTRVTAILGGAPVAGWLPDAADTTTSTDPWSGRTWTADADLSAQLSALGRGRTRAFASASSRYLTTPDTADCTFGNGTTDSPFSVFALVNVTDTAAGRQLISKAAAANVEYRFSINPSDQLQLLMVTGDQSAQSFKASNAAITMGSFRLLWATYDGSGGGSAANGIVLGQDTAAIAGTATNGAYTAMTNLTAALDIGATTAHTAQFLDGSMALAGICAGVKTTAQMAALSGLCSSYFGAP